MVQSAWAAYMIDGHAISKLDIITCVILRKSWWHEQAHDLFPTVGSKVSRLCLHLLAPAACLAIGLKNAGLLGENIEVLLYTYICM